MKKPQLLQDIPSRPGCYIYKNDAKKVIYVGKAKDLKKRVFSYFSKKNHDSKTLALVSHIKDIDFIVTDNELEALILENNLIKKYKPKYNIDLKDSKSYAFIEKTNETYPRFILSRGGKSGKDLFGPFVSAQNRDYLLELINKTFKIRTCRTLPKRVCLRHAIGLCSAPCIKEISKEDYMEDVESAILVLKGKTRDLIKDLIGKMETASVNQEFERAIAYRNQINGLTMLEEKQKVQRARKYNEDIINYIVRDSKVFLLIFNIHKGMLENKQEFVFNETPRFFEEFLTRYYSENKIPKIIVVPHSQPKLISDFLSIQKKSKVKIVVPQKGDLKNLLDLVYKNVEISFFGDFSRLEELRRVLKMQEIPKTIECFDISHLSGTSGVGSMVQFRNGKPDKSNYRRFKIRSFEGNDDFAGMREVIERRYKKLVKENLELPNLIVVDGGAGQLSSAMNILKKLNLKIPVISLAKKEEEIYIPGEDEPLKLFRKNKARLLLQAIRDEAHRFAINYNRLLRKKSLKLK